jgi:hypothetical protein
MELTMKQLTLLSSFAISGWLWLTMWVQRGLGPQVASAMNDSSTVPVTHGWIVVDPVKGPLPANIGNQGAVLDWYLPRAAAGVLVAPLAPISGFRKLSFRIWSQKRAIAAVMLEDCDKATFHAIVPLQANSWTNAFLSPTDFQINDDSPVRKRELDTRIVSPKLMVVEPKVFGDDPSNELKLAAVQVEYGGLASVTADKNGAFARNHRMFANAEPVTIRGYNGSQEDPTITPDNRYLFFDNHEDTGRPCYLYWAQRIDYKTFVFRGEIKKANDQGGQRMESLEGVEGLEDAAHNFYFVSILFRKQGEPTTIGHGTFADGIVTNVQPIKGISLPAPSSPDTAVVNFDLFVTPDGKTLYFSTFQFNVREGLKSISSSYLSVAGKNPDGSFTRLPNSNEILKNVNALGAIVYNATPSPDGLELAFNVVHSAGALPAMYIATRSSNSEPFGLPEQITAADAVDGLFSEPGSFSPDGKHLYLHRVLSPGTSQIYVITRQKG